MANKQLGNVEIKPQALAVIVSIAATEVEGVSRLVGTLKTSTLEKIGKKEYSKGVKLSFEGENLNIDVFCSLKAGYPVSGVARKIQENIRNSLFNMTDIMANSVNINIVGIDY